MSKLSQKQLIELLYEGILSKTLSNITKTLGGVAGAGLGAVKGVGKAIYNVDPEGIKGLVPFSGSAKTIAGSAKEGMKAGIKMMSPFEEKLKKFLEDSGWYLIDYKGNRTRGTAKVSDIGYDKKGKPIQRGAAYPRPVVYVTDNNGQFVIKDQPKRHNTGRRRP